VRLDFHPKDASDPRIGPVVIWVEIRLLRFAIRLPFFVTADAALRVVAEFDSRLGPDRISEAFIQQGGLVWRLGSQGTAMIFGGHGKRFAGDREPL